MGGEVDMFTARFEPAIGGYLMYYGTDLYYFSVEDMEEFTSQGIIIKNKQFPSGAMSAPLQFQLAITNRCNICCFNCYNRNKKCNAAAYKNELKLSQIKALLDYLHDWGVLFFQWSGGEPTLSRSLEESVAYAKRKGFTQSLLTNGTLLTEEKARWAAENFARVQISFNAVDRFEEWTGVNKFNSLIKGLEKASNYCSQKGASLNITTTVNEISITELEKIAYWVDKINPTHWRIGEEVPLGKAKAQNRHMELLEQSYQIFLKVKDHYKKNNWHHCFEVGEADSLFPVEWQSSPAGRTMLYMSAEGNVYPFPYLKMPEFLLGKYPKDDLKNIWFHSQILNELRMTNYANTGCNDCKNTCVRWAREINFHFNKNIFEQPATFTNCPRKK